MPNLGFEVQYRVLGLAAQRQYPNEELLRFMGRNFFSLDREDRARIRILEIGCGSGANLWAIAKEGFQAYGTDISRTGLQLCTQTFRRWETRGTLCCADCTALPYVSNWFDAVVDVVSLQHLTLAEHRSAYSECWRVLKTGGRLFSFHLGSDSYSFHHSGGNLVDRFTVDNIANPNAPLHGNSITCFLDKETTERMLKEAGFGGIQVETVTKTYRQMAIKIEYLVIEATKPE